MNIQNNRLSRVLGVIQEIAEISAAGEYIYRGEPMHYEKVSSSLYRERPEIEAGIFDINVVQTEILRAAKQYTRETDQFEILTKLQHYGGATNLIDFTTDYLIALFFACDSNFEEDGRIILLQKMNPYIVEPKSPVNRIIAQKSVFIQSPHGFIEPDREINISRDIKQPMLNYLQKCHGISTETIYNDLHGFIKDQKVHQSAYKKYHAGFIFQKRKYYQEAIEYYTESIKLRPWAGAYNNRGMVYYRLDDYDSAIEDLTKAIELDGKLSEAYNNRGTVYRKEREFDLAINDFGQAIELKPDYAEAYSNRGNAYDDKGEVDLAISDYSTAIELNPRLAEPYNNRGIAYRRKGLYDLAIVDFNQAIRLKPNHAQVYFNRGMCWMCSQNWQKAKSDLTVAREMGMDVIVVFLNTYGSVDGFEQENSVQLPEYIVAMLTQQQA